MVIGYHGQGYYVVVQILDIRDQGVFWGEFGFVDTDPSLN